MKTKGYFGIGCFNMKTLTNYGTLFRTAHVFNADFVFLIGRRFLKQPTDTMKSWRHMPMFEYGTFDDFIIHLPLDSELVGIEMNERSKPIKTLNHPDRAVYLLGAEDKGLPDSILDKCHRRVFLPGERSLNVAVAGSIVLFDRIQKVEG